MVAAEFPFGVSTAGLNRAVLCAGTPETLKEMGLVNPFAVGATLIWRITCPPALVVAAPGPLRENPSTVNAEAAVVPPPGAGLVTVTFTGPSFATSLAGIDADRLVALLNVVVAVLPLKFTTDFATKLAPLIVSVKAVPPAAWFDPSPFSEGTGLLTVKVCGADGAVVGPGFITVTADVPAAATSAAKMAAVTLVLLTNVVDRFAPLIRTVAPFTKPVPLTVRVKGLAPTAALEGERDVSAGGALLIVKDAAFEVLPPGAGLVTVTLTTRAVRMSAAVMPAVN